MGPVIVFVGMVCFFGISGCGYQFSGQTGALYLSGIRNLYIEPFVAKSREVGLEWDMTMALKSEFYSNGDPRIVSRVEEADAILSGVVRGLETRVLASNEDDEVLIYEAALVVDVSLRGRSPDRLIWRGQEVRLAETYSGSRGAVVITSTKFKTGTLNASDIQQFTDIQLTEAMSRNTREQLLRTFARQLHQKLLDSF
jgi:hypothetical protein